MKLVQWRRDLEKIRRRRIWRMMAEERCGGGDMRLRQGVRYKQEIIKEK